MVRRAFTAVVVVVLCLMINCKDGRTTRTHEAQVVAAASFTRLYAASRLASWHLCANAAGNDCSVLFVQTPIVLEESMVEAMHYGGGAYGVYAGGVQQFAREHAFHGVAYKDVSGRIWTFGSIAPHEAEALVPCR